MDRIGPTAHFFHTWKHPPHAFLPSSVGLRDQLPIHYCCIKFKFKDISGLCARCTKSCRTLLSGLACGQRPACTLPRSPRSVVMMQRKLCVGHLGPSRYTKPVLFGIINLSLYRDEPLHWCGGRVSIFHVPIGEL